MENSNKNQKKSSNYEEDDFLSHKKIPKEKPKSYDNEIVDKSNEVEKTSKPKVMTYDDMKPKVQNVDRPDHRSSTASLFFKSVFMLIGLLLIMYFSFKFGSRFNMLSHIYTKRSEGKLKLSINSNIAFRADTSDAYNDSLKMYSLKYGFTYFPSYNNSNPSSLDLDILEMNSEAMKQLKQKIDSREYLEFRKFMLRHKLINTDVFGQ